MKKLLLSLAAAVCTLAVSAGEAVFDFATNTYGYEAQSGSSRTYMEDGSSFSEGDVTVTVNKLSGSGVRFWVATNGTQFRVMKTSGFTITVPAGVSITSISLEGNASVGKMTVNDVANIPQVDAAYVWTGTTDKAVVVNTSGATVQINKMIVTYTGQGAPRQDAGLVFSATEVTGKVGTPFTAPTLTKATTADVTYSSSNPEAATVDETTGQVTLVAQGTTVITAFAPSNEQFNSGSASYTLTVTEDNPTVAIYTGLTDSIGDWTIDVLEMPEDLTFVWTWDANNKYAKASAYKGACFAAEANLTSPEIKLAGYYDLSLTFEQAANKFGTEPNVLDFVNILISADGGAFTSATVDQWPAGNNWTFVKSSIDLSAYAGKTIRVKFAYTSTAEIAGSWEIKKFNVKGRPNTSGVAEIEEAAQAPAVFYNIQGQKVANPTSGLYIKVQGGKATKVVL